MAHLIKKKICLAGTMFPPNRRKSDIKKEEVTTIDRGRARGLALVIENYGSDGNSLGIDFHIITGMLRKTSFEVQGKSAACYQHVKERNCEGRL